MSLRDLGARVGMRAPSLYSYFPSKAAIYDAMFAGANLELLARLEPIAAATGGDAAAASRLRRGSRAWMRFCCEDPVRFQLLYQRTIPDFVPTAGSFELAERVVAMLTAVLAEAGRTSSRDADLFTAYLNGLAAQQIANDPGGSRWSRLVDHTVATFLDPPSPQTEEHA